MGSDLNFVAWVELCFSAGKVVIMIVTPYQMVIYQDPTEISFI